MAELNAATAIGGDLANDSGARALKRNLAQLAGSVIMPGATGAARTLADIGVKTERDGTFSLDTARLNATIASDPEGVAAMFTNGINGVFATIDKIQRTSSSSADPGSLGGSISRYTKQLQQISEDQADLTEKQETLRQQLVSRFAVSENRIASSKSTLTFLQNQIDAWNNQGGN
jgi:flagellar hook-associated protein 2